MSEGNLKHVMSRIKGATPDSKIAVFRTDRHEHFNAVFASTVATQQMIAAKDPAFIGVYDGTMDMHAVQNILSRHIGG